MGRNVGGVIKSIQRGVSTPTGSATLSVTISPVNLSRSFLNISTQQYVNPGSLSLHRIEAKLTSVDAVTILASFGDSPATGLAVNWEVIEFN